jgi:CubicO group peptidase (beta-lactamase class C family)
MIGKTLSSFTMIAIAMVAVLAGCGGASSDRPEESTLEPAPGIEFIDAAALEEFITEQMEELHIPGVAVAIVDREGVVFSAGYGWADVENRVPMTPDTVTNIASISKTFTNAAVMQLVEEGQLGLDDDVGQHLPFAVRHPEYPEVPITVRQLLTHTSGIEDGDAYDASYACGDPAVSLADWIRGYFEPGGEFYSAEQNFLPTAPGEAYSYSNLGFGLLGYLVEVVSGVPFAEYVGSNIFGPLGMTESGFYLADFEPGRRAEPYAWVEAGDTLDNALFGERNGEAIDKAGFVPFCPYSFYNLPDGLVRTSVSQLARYLVAHIRGGELDGQRILEESTVATMLSPQLDPELTAEEGSVQGLAWSGRETVLGELWGHNGADPGIRSVMQFDPASGRGVIIFANRANRITPIFERLLEEVEEGETDELEATPE